MNLETVKKDIAVWIKAVLPIEIRWDAGTFTGGSVAVTVGSTTVTQNFTTNLNTTMIALSVKIAAIENVMGLTLDTTNRVISFLSMGSFLVTSVNRTAVTGTIQFTIPTFPFIWEDQNAPRPSVPYIAGKISIVRSIGQDYIGAPNASGINQITGNRELMLLLQSFGEGALALLNSLKNASLRDSSRRSFADIGLIVIDDSGLTDISALTDSRIEPRAALDWRIRTTQIITDAPGYIGSVAIEETIFGPDLLTITVDTITIG
jgi:hypothetical protein